jgi:hypothetical protein
MSGQAIAFAGKLGGRTFDFVAGLGFDPSAPFPSSDIRFGTISLGTRDGRDVVFGQGTGKVTFSGSAEASTGIAVNSDSSRLLRDLRPGGEPMPGLRLLAAPDHHFVMLRSGYAMSGAAQGGMALFGGGKVTFGADGRQQGTYAVIRQTPVNQPAGEAIKDVVKCWQVPHQIQTPDDLAPGTWVVAEVEGPSPGAWASSTDSTSTGCRRPNSATCGATSDCACRWASTPQSDSR